MSERFTKVNLEVAITLDNLSVSRSEKMQMRTIK